MNNKNSILIPNKVFELLSTELNRYDLNDFDVCHQIFEESKNQIETYRTAVERGSTNMPTREEIGISCYWLLMLSDLIENEKHWKLIIQLLNVDKGISLYQKLNDVLELKSNAIENVELIVKKAQTRQEKLNNYEIFFDTM